jgi:hypothetical protein
MMTRMLIDSPSENSISFSANSARKPPSENVLQNCQAASELHIPIWLQGKVSASWHFLGHFLEAPPRQVQNSVLSARKRLKLL